MATIKDFTYKPLDTNLTLNPNEDLNNKVVLIVNVDSAWGWTKPTYEELNVLHTKYADQGLVIITQPNNQFNLGTPREPLDGQELLDFINMTFEPKWKFILEKADVKGKNITELYQFLINHKNTRGTFGNQIKWSFTKFLCDKDGVPRYRFGSSDSPLKFEKKIQKLLGEISSKTIQTDQC